jgi:hypothetical protein
MSGLFVPGGPDFQWYYSNALATRPSTTSMGTTVTPAVAPTFGAWAQVATAANIANDVYGVLICINNAATSATTRNILMDLGVDNAGGTTYLTKIPYLQGGNASTYGLGHGGIWYYFPLYINRGSSIAVRAMGTTTATFQCMVTFFGQPRRPDVVRAGTYVDAYGFNTATAAGTAVTPGTTAEGTWTQLGTTTDSYWWWQCGFNVNDTTMSALMLHADLAAGTAAQKKILFENQPWQTTAAEQTSCLLNTVGAYNNTAAGDIIYGRLQVSGTADTGNAMIAYGLGG